jgi:hypothetical protein
MCSGEYGAFEEALRDRVCKGSLQRLLADELASTDEPCHRTIHQF